MAPDIHINSIQTNSGRWCFIDGSWKDKNLFSGQGWFSTLPGFVRGTKCTCMSITSPFGDGGIDMGNGMYEEFKTGSCYVCNGLFSVGEDGFGTRGMASIWNLSGRH